MVLQVLGDVKYYVTVSVTHHVNTPKALTLPVDGNPDVILAIMLGNIGQCILGKLGISSHCDRRV